MCSQVVGKYFLTKSKLIKTDFYLDDYKEFIPRDTQQIIADKIIERKLMIDEILKERDFKLDLFEFIIHKKILPPSDKQFLFIEKQP
jgi:hypothetical protein